MFCIKCGNKMNEGAAFCQKCGAAKTGTTNVSATQPSSPTPPVAGTLPTAPIQHQPVANSDTATQATIVSSCKAIFYLRLADVALWIITIFTQFFTQTTSTGVVVVWSIVVIAANCVLALQLRNAISPQAIFDTKKFGTIIGHNMLATLLGGGLFVLSFFSSFFAFAWTSAVIGVAIIVFLVKAFIAMNKISEGETLNEISQMLDAGETIVVAEACSYVTSSGKGISANDINAGIAGLAALTGKRLIFKRNSAFDILTSVFLGRKDQNNGDGTAVGKEFIIQLADVLKVDEAEYDAKVIHTKSGESYALTVNTNRQSGQQWISHLKSMTRQS